MPNQHPNSPDQLPAFPVITNAMFEPPHETVPEIIGTSSQRLNLIATGAANTYVADIPSKPCPLSTAFLLNYWGDTPPQAYTLTMRHYWRLMESQVVSPGADYSVSYTNSHGISTTDSSSISASLGVEAAGLSASLTVEFGHSIEISDESSVQNTYDVHGPAEGKMVWILWQLINEIVALDPNGNVISAVPPSHSGKGDLNLQQDVGGITDGYIHGADLRYPSVQVIIPSSTLRIQTQLFK